MKISELDQTQYRRAWKKYKDYTNNRRARGHSTWQTFEEWYYTKLDLGLQPWISARGHNRNYRSRLRYNRHRAQAKFRNIPFDFTWEAWHQWWLDHGVDKNTQPVQRGSGRLCMCRYGDEGAYTDGNVYLATHSENTSDAARNGRHGGGRPRGSKNRSKG